MQDEDYDEEGRDEKQPKGFQWCAAVARAMASSSGGGIGAGVRLLAQASPSNRALPLRGRPRYLDARG